MKKESLLIVGVVVIACLLLGGILISRSGRQAGPSPAPSGSMQIGNSLQHVQLLQKMVEQTPRNRRAWVELGNNYYDSGQYMAAVQAYDRALKLQPDDPDVLTDQGVMFRRLGWYDRAIKNFKQANRLDPKHIQSLYNLGVVYFYDLKDIAHAREAWSRYLAINPNGPGSDQVRKEMETLNKLTPPPSST